ncbi:MAG: DUF1648 domain-containing protein, partial [Plantibacter flavus]
MLGIVDDDMPVCRASVAGAPRGLVQMRRIVQDPMTASAERPVRRPPVWPHLVALVIVAATLVIGLVVYPSAPDPMPVHVDAALRPDA